MKHADLMDDKDRADLCDALKVVEEGRLLKRRVMARLRARAWRRAHPTEHQPKESGQ